MSAGGGGNARGVIVAGQVALATILLVQVTLLVRAAWSLTNRDPGFEVRQVLTFRVELPAAKYAQPAARAQFFKSLLERTEALPEVVSAGGIDRLPVADEEPRLSLTFEGAPQRPVEELPLAARMAITPGYLRTLQIPLITGRDITEADIDTDSPVALVSEEAARRFWPGESPLGSRIRFVSESGGDRWLTVVGVVGNVRHSDADQGPLLQVYVPAASNPTRALAIVVRTSAPDPLALVAAIRAEVARLDPNQPIHDVSSMEQVVFNELSSTYLLMVLLGTVALVALCLAAAGVYGVVSYAVTQRTREIGVRMALGARPLVIQRMILTQGSIPVACGGIVGLATAAAVAVATTPPIAEVNVRDPTNYGAVVLCMTLIAIGASYLPAWRASRVDPAITLRAE